MKRDEWVLLGRRRIISILRERILASEKQLESKIAESGPKNKLCNPHILSTARLSLERENQILQIKDDTGMPFYYLNGKFDSNNPTHKERQEKLFSLYQDYRRITAVPELCGSALEKILWGSIDSSNLYLPIGSRSAPVENFGSIRLPGKLDMILLPKEGATFAALVEAKNIREWIYPTNILLWKLIDKSLAFLPSGYPTVPVLVSRKIQQSARSFFKTAGILGLDTHYQYFDPSVETQLEEIRHTDGLGFKDVRIIEEPQAYVHKFFATGLPKQAPSFAKRFAAIAPILKRYTPIFTDRNIGFAERSNVWKKLSKDLKISAEYDDYDEDY